MTTDVAEQQQHLLEAAEIAGMQLVEVVLPAERFVETNGMKLRLLDWGKPDLPTILFVHGAGLTARTWDLVCLALRQQYRCLALELRGHGESSWSPEADYSLEAHLADLEGVVEQLGVRTFTLVGMSLGGGISLAFAGEHANRLDRLVIVDTGPNGRAAGRQRIRNFAVETPELDSVDDFVAKAMAFNPLRRPEMLRRSLLHNLRQTPSGTWTWKWDPRLHHGQTDETRTRRREMLWAAVPHITCPTLVVRGGKSDVLHDEDAVELAAALPRGSWVKIEGAGHTVQGDQPKLLVQELERFFATSTSS